MWHRLFVSHITTERHRPTFPRLVMVSSAMFHRKRHKEATEIWQHVDLLVMKWEETAACHCGVSCWTILWGLLEFEGFVFYGKQLLECSNIRCSNARAIQCSHAHAAQLLTRPFCSTDHIPILLNWSHAPAAQLLTRLWCSTAHTPMMLICSHAHAAQLITYPIYPFCSTDHTPLLLNCSHTHSAQLLTRPCWSTAHTPMLLNCSHAYDAHLLTRPCCSTAHIPMLLNCSDMST